MLRIFGAEIRCESIQQRPAPFKGVDSFPLIQPPALPERRRQALRLRRALLQRELVLEGGEPDLAVGQERLPHDDGQQGGDHHRDGDDGEEPASTGAGAAPSYAAPGASRDDPERGAPS